MQRHVAAFLLIVGLSSGVVAEEAQITYNGLRLNANLEKADDSWPVGPLVLMVHGSRSSGRAALMRGLQGIFRDRGISTLAITLSLGVDNRHGTYDCAAPHAYKLTDALGEIDAWVDWLRGQGTEELVLLGYSYGANQVARYGAVHPGSMVSLVALVAPPTRDESKEAATYRGMYGKDLQPLVDQARRMAARGRGGAFMEHIGFLQCQDARATADAFLSYYGPDPAMDTPGVIPRIKSPVVVFAGTNDRSDPDLIPEMQRVADGDHVRLAVLDGADHFFQDLYGEDIGDIVAELLTN